MGEPCRVALLSSVASSSANVNLLVCRECGTKGFEDDSEYVEV